MRLKEDVVSNFNGFIYAKKGSEVLLISTSLHVAIVEDKETKKRFSCHIENLTEEDVPVTKAVIEQPIKEISKPAPKAKLKKHPEQQSTLF